MSSLKVGSTTSQKDFIDPVAKYPQAVLDGGKIIAQKGTVRDITNVVEKLGLNSASDIIFNGTNAVAVEQFRTGRPCPIVILKITREADKGFHELVISGYSNKGQLTSIDLKVDVIDT